MLPQDEIALKQMLNGIAVLPQKIVDAYDKIRAFRNAVTGGDGPMSLDTLATICINQGLVAGAIGTPGINGVNWSRVPQGTPVMVNWHGANRVGTFKARLSSGILEVKFADDEMVQPIQHFKCEIYTPVDEQGKSAEPRVEVYVNKKWLPGTEKCRPEEGRVTVSLDGDEGEPKTYSTDKVRPLEVKELVTA
jgi:hypothetical protein